MAVAACVGVLAIGVAALVAVNGNSGNDGNDVTDGADESGAVPVVADDAPDTTAALVIEGDPGVGSTSRSDGDRTTVTFSTEATDSSTTSTREKESTKTSPTSTMPLETVPLETMPPEKTPPESFPTETVWPKEPSPDDGDGTAETVSVRGMVTEVFTDCVSRLVLDESGRVVNSGPVSCDGGSYIMVNGTRIFTSSGFTSADQAYDKHPSNLKPGQDVVVTAAPIGGANGPLGLACSSCRVRIV